jgi:TfoX/Sxy family transcriptional regulator of competence genes
MSYDEALAARVRRVLASDGGAVAERKMFGGLCFMLNGALCCGVLEDKLIVRVGPEQHAAAIARPHTRVFDFTGRASKGMIEVEPAGQRGVTLRRWIERGVRFAATQQKRAAPR